MKHHSLKKRFLQSPKYGRYNADYTHAERVCKDFKINNLGEYCELCGQSHTLFLADTFENFRNVCLEIYDPDPAHFLTAPELA